MSKWNRAAGLIRVTAAASLLSSSLAFSAGAGPVYRYESEEGTLSFTDSMKKVPSRYQSQSETLSFRPLRDYARYTPQAADAGYSERIAARLEVLRKARAEESARAAGIAGHSGGVSLRTSSSGAPGLEIAADASGEPLVVETLFTRPEGKMVTRQTLVAKRGDEVVAIVKNRLREWDVNEDIHLEEDLER
jgi:hypothetical protein